MTNPTGDIPTREMDEITGDPPAKLKRFSIWYNGRTTVAAATREEALMWFYDHILGHGKVTGVVELPE